MILYFFSFTVEASHQAAVAPLVHKDLDVVFTPQLIGRPKEKKVTKLAQAQGHRHKDNISSACFCCGALQHGLKA